METINWQQEVEKRKDDIIKDLQGILQIPSVRNEEEATEDAPFGVEVKKALDYMLQLGKRDGFTIKNTGNVAGHIEMGEGEGLIGVLGHVDVVPVGENWSVEPFSGTVKDGKIISRGAIDDKGPTLAAYYGMKIVKELNLPLQKRVRLIIGTDEESDWRCMDHYFQVEEMPDMGFAPDADFPIIIAEKGIWDVELVQTTKIIKDASNITLLSLSSGLRPNMVPDYAKAELKIDELHTDMIQRFDHYLKDNHLKGNYYVDKGHYIFEIEGKAAHGSEPDKGINAGLHLIQYLSTLPLDEKAAQFITMVTECFKDTLGESLNIAFEDDVSGKLTVNLGVISYEQQSGGRLALTIRYPVTYDVEQGMKNLEQRIEAFGFQVDSFSDSKPHYVPEDSELVQILKKVYEEQTGEEARVLAIGGGTYARSLKKGVAFGALFPGRPDVAHQRDEYIEIEDLLKATAIYAQAIYELARNV